jgi:ABC-type uncharacterized transport system substrate-binding protein
MAVFNHHPQVAAQALDLTLQHLGVRDANDVDWALTMMAQHHLEALFMITDMLTTPQRRRILDFAAAHRLPVMYEVRELVKEGGLLAYGPNMLEQARRAAAYVDKLLKGAKPADLPVDEPTRLELVMNLKAAEELGLTIPPTLLFQADEVIR